ncbi:uncharacterized protein N7496_011247 [Penicillium cataractarum]|uniref:Uncharacterized protein n=1 Tax=Penicillium cataractarum TaxID=2100454 RepID=A0A9W9RH96_9EURO|nr:uncharacterized protein N7496_011247 [Penicillium cataractarum]KAJ5358834.1 hypothetical protein N7496_011247 [Penicillium cataractarum]
MLITHMDERQDTQSEASQQTRYDRTSYPIMSRNSINSIPNDRGSISGNEPRYAIHTFSSRGHAGLPCSLERQNFSSTPSGQPTCNGSPRGGRQNRTEKRRPSQSSDDTSVFSSGAGNAAEPGTSSQATSVHEEEGDKPNLQTQQEEDGLKEPVQEMGGENSDSGLEIEGSTSSPGDATPKPNPPNGTCTQQKEQPEKEVVTNPDPAPEPKSPVEVEGDPTPGPANDGTPSGQPGPASKSTSRQKSMSSSRFFVNPKKRQFGHDGGTKPLGEGLVEVKPQITWSLDAKRNFEESLD